ncbi:hypothetical protein [Paraflavitalea speifideaquila]|uniref:hypothetical protein n=1 Tax=Paraflavitalea speifideaquila TaxID=3076558 RepID=UPI0028F0B120|nr:hypothetical protein [Paraflavitalea speifideiaquila]
MTKVLYEKIKELEKVAAYSKHDRLVQGIIAAINEKILVPDDTLPSVNTMIRELRFSRETIIKGYHELVSRGSLNQRTAWVIL